MIVSGIFYLGTGLFCLFEAFVGFDIFLGNSQAQLWLRLFGMKKAKALCFLLGLSMMIWGVLIISGILL